MDIYKFIITAIVLSVMPGPDILLIVSTSALQGIKKGITLALGFASGLIFHTIAVSLGIAAIIAQNEAIFNIIKYLGIIYLLYIGIMGVINSKKENINNKNVAVNQSLYKKGVILNLLNPKVSLFFLSLFPQFITESTNKSLDSLILGSIMCIITAIVFCSTAVIFGFIGDKSKQIMKNKVYVAVVQLAIYIALAVMISFY